MVLALLALALGLPSSALAAAPFNDDFDYPTAITTSPATTTMSEETFNAANDVTQDPNVCGYGNPGVHTVWYTFMPTANGTVSVTTVGSGFDTILAIWTGTRGNLQSLGCNDDNAGGLQAVLSNIALQVNVKYYIEVVQFTAGTGMPKPTHSITPAVSNSPVWLTLQLSYSAATNIASPGKYDDKSTVFTYGGTWSSVTNSASYLGAYKTSKVINNIATFVMKGNQFNVIYTAGSSFGNLGVYVDGIQVDTINEGGTTAYQKVYNYSGTALTNDFHIVKLKHLSKYVSIDAVEVFAPPDLIPPSAISDLVATPGVTFGNVDLQWTATGNDGLDGVATSYDVRYSVNPIVDDPSWNAATKITAGVPTPAIPGTHQSMSVTGLSLSQVYYFAIRALDDPAPDSTPGGLSNSPSSSASYAGPFGAGLYDDTDTAKWMYSGTWTSTAATGAQGGSYRTSSVIGNSATFVFQGTGFNFYYTVTTYGGTMNVYVDGALVTSLNQKASATAYKKKYASPVYTLGQHAVQFVHSAGSKTYVDAIQVIGPPDVDPPVAITDLSAVQGTAFGSVNLSWTAPAEDSTGSSSATTYLVRYSTSDIVDETTWSAATAFTNSLTPKTPGQAETLAVTGLNPGTVYYLSVRAVDEAGNIGGLGPSSSATAMPVVPVGTGTYQNTDAHWIYSAGFVLLTNSNFDGGSCHRSATVGSTATILINVTSAAPYDGFQFEFATGPAYGKLEIWVDGVLKTTINQYATSTTAKYKQKLGIWGLGGGNHTIVFKHLSGTYVNIDAIIIP
jgi:hypothetical protein